MLRPTLQEGVWDQGLHAACTENKARSLGSASTYLWVQCSAFLSLSFPIWKANGPDHKDGSLLVLT